MTLLLQSRSFPSACGAFDMPVFMPVVSKGCDVLYEEKAEVRKMEEPRLASQKLTAVAQRGRRRADCFRCL